MGNYLYDINSRDLGSRLSVDAEQGDVTKGPPFNGTGSEKATSGISLVLPARGKSFRRG